MTIYELIGLRLKEARELRGYNLQEVSKLINLSKSTLSRYENGKVENMKVPILNTLADIYKVNDQWLLGKSEQRDKTNKFKDSYFMSSVEAIEFIMTQNVISNITKIDISKYSDEDKKEFTKKLLDYARWIDSELNNKDS